MSDDNYVSMPESYRKPFHDAVVKLRHWRLGEREPEVSFEGPPCPIGMFFGLMTKFDQDKMSDEMLLLARGIFDETGAAEKGEIDSNPFYGNAAKVFARRVTERHEQFKRHEDLRRS
jgi:hypothetical protein